MCFQGKKNPPFCPGNSEFITEKLKKKGASEDPKQPPECQTDKLLTKSQEYFTKDENCSKFPEMFINDSSNSKMTQVNFLNAQIWMFIFLALLVQFIIL